MTSRLDEISKLKKTLISPIPIFTFSNSISNECFLQVSEDPFASVEITGLTSQSEEVLKTSEILSSSDFCDVCGESLTSDQVI